MNTENFIEELMEVAGVKLRVTDYKIGDVYHCHVYNLDPGACIARSSSDSRETAREEAISKAKHRLLKTAGDH